MVSPRRATAMDAPATFPALIGASTIASMDVRAAADAGCAAALGCDASTAMIAAAIAARNTCARVMRDPPSVHVEIVTDDDLAGIASSDVGEVLLGRTRAAVV